MGYTNYWTQPTDFTDQQWSKVKMEADYIRSWAELPEISKYVEVEIKKDEILVYGPCETMVFQKIVKQCFGCVIH